MTDAGHMPEQCVSNDRAAEGARTEHEAIVKEAADLRNRWAGLARRCLSFQNAKSYRLVVNPATGQPFRTFRQWVECVFGKSGSTMFAATRIIRELKGLVRNADLDQMSKENAEELVRRKRAGDPITPELAENAKRMTARELKRERRENAQASADGTSTVTTAQATQDPEHSQSDATAPAPEAPKPEARKPPQPETAGADPEIFLIAPKRGEFMVTRKTLELFQKALEVADKVAPIGPGHNKYDRNLRFIVETFLAKVESGTKQAVA